MDTYTVRSQIKDILEWERHRGKLSFGTFYYMKGWIETNRHLGEELADSFHMEFMCDLSPEAIDQIKALGANKYKKYEEVQNDYFKFLQICIQLKKRLIL